jgi:hypothetical protein
MDLRAQIEISEVQSMSVYLIYNQANEQCAVGEVSPNQTSSTYSFLLRKEMALYARHHDVTNIKVEQICEWSQYDDERKREDEEATDGGRRNIVLTLSTHKTEAMVPFDGSDKYTVNPSFSSASSASCPFSSSGRSSSQRAELES